MRKLIITMSLLFFLVSPVWGATWIIGDNDGYGIGIPDNGVHPFDGFNPSHDGRTDEQKSATNGAQYTNTYSTTHPGSSPHSGTVATFTFDGLPSGWAEGSMWFDMADFQATTFGAVHVTYNSIVQDWAFNDGFPNTVVRFFDLEQDVITSINDLGSLEIVIDRNNSDDFYGFDYVMLSDRKGEDTFPVPEPGTLFLLGSGLAGLALYSRRTNKA